MTKVLCSEKRDTYMASIDVEPRTFIALILERYDDLEISMAHERLETVFSRLSEAFNEVRSVQNELLGCCRCDDPDYHKANGPIMYAGDRTIQGVWKTCSRLLEVRYDKTLVLKVLEESTESLNEKVDDVLASASLAKEVISKCRQ